MGLLKYSILMVMITSVQAQAKLNIQGAAQSGVTTYVTMSVMNGIASKEYKAKCTGQNYMACVGAALTAGQALMAGTQAVDSQRTVDASECVGAFCGVDTGNNNSQNPIDGTGANLPSPVVSSPSLDRVLNDARITLNDLNDRGFTLNPDGSVSYNGNNISAQDLASGAAAGALGASASDIAEVDAIRKKDLSKDASVNKLISKIASELEGGSGGKKAAAGRGYKDSGLDYSKLFAGLNGQAQHRDLAGLEKKLGKDAIGVSQDNIFELIKRRYTIKKPELIP